MFTKAVALMLLISTPALAQQLDTRAELEILLDDQIILEDFESISVHAGTALPMPNPLTAANSSNAIHDGLTFTSENALYFVSGFFGGDDNVYLRSEGTITIDFTEPQTAFGFNFFTLSGTTPYTITLRTHDSSILEQVQFEITTSTFFGYKALTQGITSVTIEHPFLSLIAINDLAFGFTFLPCPADLNNDNNQDFLDISAFITAFLEDDDIADFNDDGQFDFLDISAFITAFSTACP